MPRAIKAFTMTNKGMFTYPTKFREEEFFFVSIARRSSNEAIRSPCSCLHVFKGDGLLRCARNDAVFVRLFQAQSLTDISNRTAER